MKRRVFCFLILFLTLGGSLFATIIATDHFNRAGPGLGSNWTANDGLGQVISSNQVGSGEAVGTSNLAGEYWNTIAFANDQWAKITLSSYTPGANLSVGVQVRGLPNGDCYFALFTEFSATQYVQVGFQHLGSITFFISIPTAWVVTDTLELDVVGTTLTTKYNGATVDTRTDATLSSGSPGVFGAGNWNNGGKVLLADNWIGGDFNASVLPVFNTQPAASTVLKTKTATFISLAAGDTDPTYQWYKNGVLIPGATSANYTTPATVFADNGAQFYNIATNTHGSTQSSTAILTVSLVNLVTDGDSITAGFGLTTPWPNLLSLNKVYVLSANVGVAGETLATMVSNAAANVDPLFIADSQVTNIVTIWGGTNDIQASTPVGTIEGLLQTYGQARQAVGWKVATIYTVDRTVGAQTPKNAYNAWMLANFQTFGNAVVPLDSRLTGDGASSNLTYFQADAIHPNQTSATTIEAPDISAALNGLLASPGQVGAFLVGP